MNILELDIGNTRIKWRLLATPDQSITCEGVADSIPALLASEFARQSPDLVRLANVRADDSLEQLQRWVSSRWQAEVQVASVSRACGGVINGYKDVTRMGVDRWLALLAAFNRFQSACLVVSAGTAITIDLLAKDGTHGGGYILPGLVLMASALESNTGIRLQKKLDAPALQPGLITEEAIYNGGLASCVALIEKCASQLAEANTRTSVVLAGGDAGLIGDALAQCGLNDVTLSHNLVLDGLAIACPAGGQVASS